LNALIVVLIALQPLGCTEGTKEVRATLPSVGTMQEFSDIDSFIDAYTSEADADAPVNLACDTPIEEISDIEEKIVGTWLIQESYLVGRGDRVEKQRIRFKSNLSYTDNKTTYNGCPYGNSGGMCALWVSSSGTSYGFYTIISNALALHHVYEASVETQEFTIHRLSSDFLTASNDISCDIIFKRRSLIGRY